MRNTAHRDPGRRGVPLCLGVWASPFPRSWSVAKTGSTILPVQRVCFLLRVRPDRLDEYKAAHRNVWPEMRDALSRHGWHNYSLFLAEDGLLVGYVETDDFARA